VLFDIDGAFDGSLSVLTLRTVTIWGRFEMQRGRINVAQCVIDIREDGIRMFLRIIKNPEKSLLHCSKIPKLFLKLLKFFSYF
jgi:hypothetical protein